MKGAPKKEADNKKGETSDVFTSHIGERRKTGEEDKKQKLVAMGSARWGSERGGDYGNPRVLNQRKGSACLKEGGTSRKEGGGQLRHGKGKLHVHKVTLSKRPPEGREPG